MIFYKKRLLIYTPTREKNIFIKKGITFDLGQKTTYEATYTRFCCMVIQINQC
jgi:hypothetical protein